MQNYKLIADKDILAIEVKDNKEALIDLKLQTHLKFGPSPEVENNLDYTKLRRTIYNKLIEAQNTLPQGLKFCLYEGYRSLALQEQLFKERYKLVQELYPSWGEEQLFIETTKLVSPIINLDGSKNIPPHSTGGAIDIYLINENGEAVEMGIHPKDWMQDRNGAFSLTNSSVISNEAKHYRKILADALLKVGFINYPTEYWHWSYGDKYWAYYTHNPYAIYGTIL